MAKWNSSPHPISDIQFWKEYDFLELQPPYQRREVWSKTARIMLIDTILREIPMPKIFLACSVKNGKTYRVVIDGQQRISAIIAFVRNEFSLDEPYVGIEKGKYFRDLDQDTKNKILSYPIDFNEAYNISEEEVREVYARVNKYTTPLTKQELRRADFPGDFLNVSQKLSLNPIFDSISLFSGANRRRYSDVEYISELIAALIDGIQDKKVTLDNFYIKYTDWDDQNKSSIVKRFNRILEEITLINHNDFSLKNTRFRNKADFYSLFISMGKFISAGETFVGKELKHLRNDLMVLNDHIRPESPIDICSEYAIKCVSQANSMSSRKWRQNFLNSILAGTFLGRMPNLEGAKIFYKLKDQLSMYRSRNTSPELVYCAKSKKQITNTVEDGLLAWDRNSTVFQISNSVWMHRTSRETTQKWIVLERPND